MHRKPRLLLIGKAAERLRPALELSGFPVAAFDAPWVDSEDAAFVLGVVCPPLGENEDVPGDLSAAVIIGDEAIPVPRGVPALVLPASLTDEQILANLDAVAGIVTSRASGGVDVEELNTIGSALAQRKNVDELLGLILETAMRLLCADAGSVFLAEGVDPENPTHLRFKSTRNDSIQLAFEEFTLPIDARSLAGYVASTRRPLRFPDVYDLPGDLPFQFNPRIDRLTGYNSRSVLSVAMTDHKDRLIGVVQIWNKKRNPSTRLTSSNISDEVLGFTQADARLLASLAGQAGIAVENASLYTEIKNLFEGFIRACVTAIEARDPSTFGHSERVAVLTRGLAEAVHEAKEGPFAADRFSADDLRELEYAAFLHDFGKIGVRESILVKANKLFPLELDALRLRLELLHRTTEIDVLRRMIRHLAESGVEGDGAWKDLEARIDASRREVSRLLEKVHRANEPNIVTEKVRHDFEALSRRQIPGLDGSMSPVISDEMRRRLTIPKGCLSDEERREVESHVVHTYHFLSRIPWTRELRGTPEIAYAHHEKIDGSGYPRSLAAHEIPLTARMMAVADVFDALAARDRPYKKALSVEKALDVLRAESAEGKLDADLVEVFISAEVYRRITDFQ